MNKKINQGFYQKALIEEIEARLPDGEYCPPHLLSYLRNTHRLTLLRKPNGKGDVAIYAEAAVEEALSYLNRHKEIQNEEKARESRLLLQSE